MNGASYLKHLRDDLIPAVKVMHPNKDFTFVQDSAPSHCASHSRQTLCDYSVFYEIIVSQFSYNQMKLNRKRKFEIIF